MMVMEDCLFKTYFRMDSTSSTQFTSKTFKNKINNNSTLFIDEE